MRTSICRGARLVLEFVLRVVSGEPRCDKRPAAPQPRDAAGAVVELAQQGFQRSLLEFTDLESTTYADIVKVFDLAERRLSTMKDCADSAVANSLAGFPSAATSARGGDGSRPDGIGHNLNRQTYLFSKILGPMDRPGEIPNGWGAASKSVKRRRLPNDWRDAVDASGTLPKGQQWRYASFCGQTLRYFHVPSEVSNGFDRIIEIAYFR